MQTEVLVLNNLHAKVKVQGPKSLVKALASPKTWKLKANGPRLQATKDWAKKFQSVVLAYN